MLNSEINSILKFPLKDFQEKDLQYAIDHHYFILAYDMGLGKSVTSLAMSIACNAKQVIIICPTYLKNNWKHEIKKFLPEFYQQRFTIVSYHEAGKLSDILEYDMCIVDEAHFTQNMDTQRSTAVHRLIFESMIERVILLTGTPIRNRVKEFYSPIRICCYNEKGTSGLGILKKFPDAEGFADYFSNREERYIKVKYRGRIISRKLVTHSGIKEVDKLKRILEGKYLRRLAKDHLKVKAKVHNYIVVGIKEDPLLLEQYETLGDTCNSSHKKKNALFKVPSTVAHAKELVELVGNVIIYSHHTEAIRAIAEKLNVPYIDGTVSVKRREEIKQMFLSGELKELCATIDSFSTGNTFVNCSNMIFNDLSWVPGDNEQSEGRIFRIGQEGIPTYHIMCGSPQDEIISRKLADKKEVIRQAT